MQTKQIMFSSASSYFSLRPKYSFQHFIFENLEYVFLLKDQIPAQSNRYNFPRNWPVLSSERAPHRYKTTNSDSKISTGNNIWSQIPQGCSIPSHTDRLSVVKRLRLRLRLRWFSPKSNVKVKSQNHVTTDGQSISMSWCLVHSVLKGSFGMNFNPTSGFFMLPLGGLRVKYAMQCGFWVPTQYLLWDQGKPRKTLIELTGRRSFRVQTDF
jgi:hypothetical protein